ncbi:PDZ/DHR/GLGF domain protein [Tepidanaerobacter acetatoxydans Re1]|uniref:PDZ/DHR/GLGF domain protein n=2 Tax=Tepidanaerobacter acetatoxydans TaxID=499229 RepID=F4LVL0_TEPAE|nr:PDZ/DHR/GLGF domain protein [Tepidanaerobacter acetatoxydans Re1]CDI40741.1 PDZ/DHR/GLGF domain protein [Tepidanaerobacter acetatoxydans Re1]
MHIIKNGRQMILPEKSIEKRIIMVSKQRKRSLQVITIIILLLGLNYYLGQTYTIVAPGITVDLKEIVTVENGSKHKEGSFFLTTVSSRTLNIPLLFYAAVDPYVNIERKEQMIPTGWDMQQYMDYMRRWMEESQKIAEVVALRKAGYNTQILGDGAQVVEIMPESTAKGKLLPGDIIKKVDKEKVNLAEEVVKKVSNHNIGEMVELEVERQNKTITVFIPTMESKTEKGKSVIGIYITTLNWKPILPLKIDIDTGDIGGPSAGSMLTMEILNQLSSENLTKGHKIAGTGTISLDEQIGEIGGVQQKVKAAYRDGAEIFFVPERNANDAVKAAEGLNIEIISVTKLDDILDYLEELK